ncbi:MAG: phospholipase D family protein [Actinomycetota bacterium]
MTLERDQSLERWYLSPSERGNPDTRIDARRGNGRAWTEGNLVEPLVHGATYFARLHEAIAALREGDRLYLTDWRGDPDERLAGPGTELASVLAGAARRGVDVRGLVWRSHPDQSHFSEQEAFDLAREVNEAGGEILLDERVRRAGSHHQKLVLLRCPDDPARDVAFVGGIDLCHGRNDDEAHRGDPQVYPLDERYGERPAWHDIQLAVRGPSIGDLAYTFRERWEDPTPLDHRNPLRKVLARRAHEPDEASPLPTMLDDPPPAGSHAVQVLRTYPAKRPAYPFARLGERSIARAYGKAMERARRLVYLEDQYLWSADVADALARALERTPGLHLIVVVPRFPEEDGAVSGPPARLGQQLALEHLREAGGERVLVCDIENEIGLPIYVHAKACVVDDVWAAVGSDNLNLRSWTHDSELSCAVLDAARDERDPRDPAGLGDGARRFARNLRLQLWREHLGRSGDEGLVDPIEGFHLWRDAADELDAWHRRGGRGTRPQGRVRMHDLEPVGAPSMWWARAAYKMAVDPDGRPRALKRQRTF